MDRARAPVRAAQLTGATFADAGAEWRRYIEHDRRRKPSTVGGYASIVRTHLLPAFGSLAIESITAATVDAWLATTAGSMSSRRKSLVLLHGILQRARKVWSLPVNPGSATSPTGLVAERRAESPSARGLALASVVVVVDQQARGLAHPFGGPAADVAEAGGAQHRSGELNVAGETLDRERARGEDASEPLDLFDAVDGAGAGIFQRPSKQVAAVVVTPGLSGGPVAFEVIGIDVVVQPAELTGERSEADLGSVAELERLRRIDAAGRGGATHVATTS